MSTDWRTHLEQEDQWGVAQGSWEEMKRMFREGFEGCIGVVQGTQREGHPRQQATESKNVEV